MTSPPRRPQPSPPALAAGSARRLVRLDVLREPRRTGETAHAEVVASAIEDVGTPDGPAVVARAELRVRVVDGRVADVDAEPALLPGALAGATVPTGFRRAAAAAVDEAALPEGPSRELLAALLDDVPVVVLVSGYLDVRAGLIAGAGGHLGDTCSGWREGGAPLQQARTTGRVPVSELTPVSDPVLPALPAGALRRLRWATVTATGGGGGFVEAGFRDSGREDDGAEGALHEYALHARIDAGSVLHDLTAEPHVLPFAACLDAAPGVTALDGAAAHAVYSTVPRLLGGPRGCTHLNDLLRSLAALPRLLGLATTSPLPAHCPAC